MNVVNARDILEVKETHIDDVLTKFNLFGRYYCFFLVLITLLILSSSLSCSNYIFTAEKVQYRCKDERFVNNTCSNLINSTEVCSEWVYENPHSFVAEFQLACQEWKRTMVGTVHNFGYGAGLLVIGPLSDRLGRKTVVVITGVIGCVLGVTRSFCNNYWLFIILEFLEAAFGDVYSPVFILLMEMVPHNKRVLSKMLCGFGGSISYGILPLSAWLFPYWRHLLRVLYGPTILFIFYIFLMDESPRWLLSKDRKDEALAVLEKIAKRSSVKIEKEIMNNIVSNEDTNKNSLVKQLKHTFTSAVLFKRFVICLVWWFTSTFVNYGLRINIVLLPGNKYINYALLMTVDIISKLGTAYMLIKFRRKIPLICAFFLAAVICFSQTFVPKNLSWLSITLVLAGKMMSAAFFTITYIFTSELFPTYTRNSMHALCSSLGRGGSIIAPQTPLLMAYWSGAPLFVFGCASLVAGLATMFAPDTADDALPDTVTQAEALGIKQYENYQRNVSCNNKKTHL